MNEWTNEFTLQFLDAYEQEPIIWNIANVCHKDKIEAKNAWIRLSKRLGVTVLELKKKKESTMATFRSLLRRKKASIKAGATGDDIYKPVWFAYDKLESFLGELYECKSNKECLTASESIVGNDENPFEEPIIQETFQQQMTSIDDSALVNIIVQNMLKKRTHEDDECDLYGKLLAKKLRKIPPDERDIVMYEIDGLLINKLIHPTQIQPSSSRYNSNNEPHSLDTSSNY